MIDYSKVVVMRRDANKNVCRLVEYVRLQQTKEVSLPVIICVDEGVGTKSGELAHDYQKEIRLIRVQMT